MPIKRNPTDTTEGIQKSIEAWALGFNALKDEPGSQDGIERFRKTMQTNIEDIDVKMMSLIQREGNDNRDLINWAARMGSCTRMFDALDRNIAFKGKRQWNWDEVVSAMAYLKAAEEGAGLTLGGYGI